MGAAFAGLRKKQVFCERNFYIRALFRGITYPLWLLPRTMNLYPMNNTKFVVKVNRGGILATQYVRRLDHTPILMTTDRKLALLMGKLTAEDAISAIQNSRCTAELVSVQVRQGAVRA